MTIKKHHWKAVLAKFIEFDAAYATIENPLWICEAVNALYSNTDPIYPEMEKKVFSIVKASGGMVFLRLPVNLRDGLDDEEWSHCMTAMRLGVLHQLINDTEE